MNGLLNPENTTFVLLSFEGPDPYARAGGLGVRVTELSLALAEAGFPSHLFFIGDPNAPGEERVSSHGRLTLHRWCQWISRYHPQGVYEGEEDKLRDFSVSAPDYIVDHVVTPAADEGRHVVVMGEEWHTAEAICRLSERLRSTGAGERMVALWNANNAFGFDRIDWPRLQASATITTVSRFMKQLMWDHGVNPLVVPNGIPQRLLDADDDESWGADLRRAIDAQTMLVKVARWDPDKRWLGAVRTVATLKARGDDPVLLARGGVEAHGREVLEEASALGLSVHNLRMDTSTPDEFIEALSGAGHPDIINITSPMPQCLLRVLYREADAVLANSGREPFGLVGLETMAAGGTAYTGNTGEDYARHMENAVVLETGDPYEAAWYVEHLAAHPDEQQRIRRGARETAQRFVWDRVTANLLGKVELLASR